MINALSPLAEVKLLEEKTTSVHMYPPPAISLHVLRKSVRSSDM